MARCRSWRRCRRAGSTPGGPIPRLLEKAVREALADAVPPARTASWRRSDTPNVYLDLDRIRGRGLLRTDVEATIEKALLATGLVKAVYTHARLLGNASDEEPYLELFRNSFFEPRSPHVMTLLKENVYLSSYAGGTGHGTAHEYDRHVPVVFMGPGITPGTTTRPSAPSTSPRPSARSSASTTRCRTPTACCGKSRHAARRRRADAAPARRRDRRGRHRADDASADPGRAAGPVHDRRPRRRQREDAAGGGRPLRRRHAGQGLPRAARPRRTSTRCSSSPPAATATRCSTSSKSDKHLFVEKPVAYSLKETEEVAAAARGRRGAAHGRLPQAVRPRLPARAGRGARRCATCATSRSPSSIPTTPARAPTTRSCPSPRSPGRRGRRRSIDRGLAEHVATGRRRGLRRPDGGEAGARRPIAWAPTSSSTASSTT